jgi:hypothetical protein
MLNCIVNLKITFSAYLRAKILYLIARLFGKLNYVKENKYYLSAIAYKAHLKNTMKLSVEYIKILFLDENFSLT